MQCFHVAVGLAAALVFAVSGFAGERMGPPFPNPLLRALDADGDGALSAEEIQKAPEALKALDKDGNGALAREELFPAMPAEGRGGPGRFARPEGPPGRGRGEPPPFSSNPLAKDDSEKKILDVLDDMDRNQRRGMMNVPIADGRFLRFLAEAIEARHVVEIGTSNGYSGIWICLALKKTGGKLTTHEINQERAQLARRNFERAGVSELVTLVEGDAHETVKKIEGPVDMVFIDADKEGYTDYLEKLLPKVRPGGIIVAHNIDERMADPKYIRAITENPELETFFPGLVGSGGVSVTMKKR